MEFTFEGCEVLAESVDPLQPRRSRPPSPPAKEKRSVRKDAATKEPAAVRTTKDVDVLIRRDDLPRARAAALSVGMDYFEVLGVGMFLDRKDPNPRHAVHPLWAGEKVRPEYELPSPTIDRRQTIAGIDAVSLPALVLMKLLSNRDQDRVHLRDMIDVGLVGRELLEGLPPSLAERLDALLSESGR